MGLCDCDCPDVGPRRCEPMLEGAYHPLGNPKDRLAQAQDKDPLHYLEPAANREIARALASGAAKYGYRNFTIEPIKATVYIDALLRHISAWRDGEDFDPETGLHHLAHVGANVHVALAAMTADKFTDDRAGEVKGQSPTDIARDVFSPENMRDAGYDFGLDN